MNTLKRVNNSSNFTFNFFCRIFDHNPLLFSENLNMEESSDSDYDEEYAPDGEANDDSLSRSVESGRDAN